MIFSKELEKLASEYTGPVPIGGLLQSIDKYVDFMSGAAALENLIMKSVESEFDSDAALISCPHTGDCTDYVAGARWQHSRDQLIIGALREKYEGLGRNYDELYANYTNMLNSGYEKLQSENTTLKSKVDDVEFMYQTARGLISNRDAQIEKLQAENEQLKKDLAEREFFIKAQRRSLEKIEGEHQTSVEVGDVD